MTVTAIDLFAGLGGWTMGAKRAGIKMLWSANHWPKAVEYHRLNNPESWMEHVCQDLQQADWRKVPKPHIVLAAPCCQGHANARGTDKPTSDVSRNTAHAVTAAVEHLSPAAFAVENVPEFSWWKLFDNWIDAFRILGYAVSIIILDAADIPMEDGLGIPQHRERLIITGVRGSVPLVIPKPNAPHRAAPVDWDSGKWSLIDKPGRAEATLRRVANGRAAFGDTFLAPYYGNGSGLTGRDPKRPLGTVTTLDRWSAIRGDYMRMLTIDEYRRAMGFPDGTILPDDKRTAVKLLGNAICVPMAEYVARYLKEAVS